MIGSRGSGGQGEMDGTRTKFYLDSLFVEKQPSTTLVTSFMPSVIACILESQRQKIINLTLKRISIESIKCDQMSLINLLANQN